MKLSPSRAASAVIALLHTSPVLAVCNHDNLYRCFNKTDIAGLFCNSYIHIPVVTLTITTSSLSQITPTAPPVIQTPGCMPSGNSPYLQSAISSACSCISVPTSTTTIYSTPTSAPPPTNSTAAGGSPKPCTPPSLVSYHNATYAQYYHGSRYLENDANPGNTASDVFPPDTTTFPGTLDDWVAVQSCAQFAQQQEDIYLSFAVYYLHKEGVWECVAYWNSNTNGTYFDVVDEDVRTAFGYSVEQV